jgi:hypothetical protein
MNAQTLSYGCDRALDSIFSYPAESCPTFKASRFTGATDAIKEARDALRWAGKNVRRAAGGR